MNPSSSVAAFARASRLSMSKPCDLQSGERGLALWILPLAVSLLACPPRGTAPDAGPIGYTPTACANDWQQWGQTQGHSGVSCASVQTLSRGIQTIVFDPFVPLEQATNGGGDLIAHYPAPLISGDDVYLMTKTGQYVACSSPDNWYLGNGDPCGPLAWDNQIWTLVDYRWSNGALNPMWTFVSDWKPVPATLTSWEPVFQAALAGGFVYVPGAGGSVYQLDRNTGSLLNQFQPFGSPSNPNVYVAGPITADAQGAVYYNAFQLNASAPAYADVDGAWLVKIDGTGAHTQAFAALTPGAPGPFDSCLTTFHTARLPDGGLDPNTLPFPPPSLDDGGLPLPATSVCGSQRPGINVAPAIAPDGTIYTVSRAHFNSRYSYLIAANPDLSVKWAASLRDHLADGCGVLVPADAQPSNDPSTYYRQFVHCREGAAVGVDPRTNLRPAGEVWDESSSSPIVLPDGVAYGAGSAYNGDRGHLMKFGADGHYAGAYDFGWDVTPAVLVHGNGYSIVTKDNHYDNLDQTSGPYFITQLSSDLTPEWKFASSNRQSCFRLGDGGMICNNDGRHQAGFEWCINAPAIDKDGNVIVNSEDGNVYSIAQTGKLNQSYFLLEALGAAYTPLSLDAQGRVYSLNAGQLTVVGQ